MRMQIFWASLVLWIRSVAAATNATVVPAPIDVSASQQWDGNDGQWSSFTIRIGTPAQDLRVLISTASTSTWVINDPLGCDGFNSTNCADLRGELFNPNKSSTWQDNGPFDLLIEDGLGIDPGAEFGFDSVGLDFQGSGGPTMNHTVVAEISDGNFLLGLFGINPRPTNFSSFNDPQPSFMTLLHEANEIPSLSYSYNAGAKYRENGVLGSLTLGGYDEGKFSPNNLSFPFDSDQQRDLTIGIQAITSSAGSQNTSLLPNGILSFIDSTVTQMWLPIEACTAFENAYGIVYDPATDLYLLNNTQHAKLKALDPNITFTIGYGKEGGQTAEITFPYAAFDLNISYPTVAVGNESYYFPIRRANNDTQYTLGRAFLQEAYLTVDYTHNNFTVSQRTWTPGQASHIVAIGVTSNSTGNGTAGAILSNKSASGSSGISGGAIAGIVIGVLAVIAIVGGVFFYLRLRKRRAVEKEAAAVAAAVEAEQKKPEQPPPSSTLSPLSGASEIYSPPIKPPELQGDYFDGHEVDGDTTQPRAEMEASKQVFELEAPHGVNEMSSMIQQQPNTASSVADSRYARIDRHWGETTSPYPDHTDSLISPASPAPSYRP